MNGPAARHLRVLKFEIIDSLGAKFEHLLKLYLNRIPGAIFMRKWLPCYSGRKVQDLSQEPTISLINVGQIPNGDLARFFEKRQSQLSIGTFSASTLQCTSSEESSDGFPRTGSTASLPPNSSKHSHDLLPTDEEGRNLYHRTLHSLSNDIVYQKEIALGKRIGFYRLGKELGAGNFSKVKLGVHVLTKEKVAVKMMEKTKMDQKAQRLLLREIDNMELMHHPNIIRLFEAVETLSKIYLVMEYAGGGELYTYVHDNGKLTEDVAKPIFAQLVSAVAHLHSKDISHRDIKAENVIFSQPGWVKLADFGFSCKFEDGTRLNTFCGSPPYAAPELFRDTNYDGAMVDIWAMGVLLYFMLVGVTPFRGESVHDLKRNILEGGFYMPEYVSTFAQHLINRMLEMDSYKRATITELRRTYWLKDTKFPESYLQLSLTPDEKELENNEIERYVWDTLHSYGIDEEMIREAAGKGARNSIIGTYRIVLYVCQAKERNEQRQKIHDNLLLLAERNRYLAAKMKQQSKTCAII
ncbi:protein kinase domain-containing protein [Ditylenchus destructor]|nr:protein kinase domain-containing protein [Ditylenchus destructor]